MRDLPAGLRSWTALARRQPPVFCSIHGLISRILKPWHWRVNRERGGRTSFFACTDSIVICITSLPGQGKGWAGYSFLCLSVHSRTPPADPEPRLPDSAVPRAKSGPLPSQKQQNPALGELPVWLINLLLTLPPTTTTQEIRGPQDITVSRPSGAQKYLPGSFHAK